MARALAGLSKQSCPVMSGLQKDNETFKVSAQPLNSGASVSKPPYQLMITCCLTLVTETLSLFSGWALFGSSLDAVTIQGTFNEKVFYLFFSGRKENMEGWSLHWQRTSCHSH